MTDLSIFDFSSAAPLSFAQAEARQNRINAEEIRERLNQDVRGFVQFLYSGRAHVRGRTAYIGNVHGTPGASLSIVVAGERVGLWHDFATGEGGDLIDLFLAYRGYDRSSFQLALKEIAKDFLHWDVQIDSAPRISLRQHIERKKIELGTEPRADHVLLGAPVAKFYYRDLQGNVIASVVRYEPDGTRESKTFRPYHFRVVDGERRWGPGAPEVRPLYRLADIVTHDCVVLCEGEGCADALASLGIAATSAMQGAEAPIGKTEWHYLAGKQVVIWPDNDPPGRAYADRVAAHLGLLGCRVSMVQVPASARPKWDAADAVAEQVDVKALIEGAVAFTRAESRIRILDISELENLPPPTWLIQDIITENGLSVWWGRSGSLKTFVGLDFSLCVASGSPWFGHPVKPGLVVYIAAEGAFGLAKRTIGWIATRGDGLSFRFKLIPHPVSMVQQVNELIKALEILGAISLIVVDTLARTFGSGHENDTADMGAYVCALDALRAATGAHVAVIHHSGKDEERGERGNIALRGASDTIVYINRISKNELQLVNESPKGKQKDADEFKAIKLRTQVTEFDQAGQRATTLILMPNDNPFPEGDEDEKPREKKLGGLEKLIIEAVANCGRPVGLTSLQGMTNGSKASVYKAAKRLVEKGILSEIRPEDGEATLWQLVV